VALPSTARLLGIETVISLFNSEGTTMATKVLRSLQDDIDGSDAVETVRFALDGVEWEIDLSERNANRLRNSLSVFMAHGRKVGGKRERKPASSNDIDARAIQWHRDQLPRAHPG